MKLVGMGIFFDDVEAGLIYGNLISDFRLSSDSNNNLFGIGISSNSKNIIIDSNQVFNMSGYGVFVMVMNASDI